MLKLYSNFFSHPPEARGPLLAKPAHSFLVERESFQLRHAEIVWYIINTAPCPHLTQELKCLVLINFHVPSHVYSMNESFKSIGTIDPGKGQVKYGLS